MGYELLLSEEFVVFSTRAFAVASGVSLPAATRQLGRYAARGMLVRLARGIWASTNVMWSETRCPYRIATPEKALLDTLYLSTRKGRHFRMLPELELGRGFNQRRFARLLTTLVRDVRIRSAVQQSMKFLHFA